MADYCNDLFLKDGIAMDVEVFDNTRQMWPFVKGLFLR